MECYTQNVLRELVRWSLGAASVEAGPLDKGRPLSLCYAACRVKCVLK